MKIISLILTMVLIVTVSLNGENLGELPDVMKPESMKIYKNKLYVVQGASVLVYDLNKNLEKVAVFGKKGSGPGETQPPPFMENVVTVNSEGIIIESLNKILRYSFDYKYISEIKKPGPRIMGVHKIKEGYLVGSVATDKSTPPKAFKTIVMMDKDLKEKKELCRQIFSQQGRRFNMVPDAPGFVIADSKIFIEKGSEAFLIEVYDLKGNKLFEIRKKEKLSPFTGKDKEIVLERFKNDPLVKAQMKNAGGWNNYRKMLDFIYPENYPYINFIETDGKMLLVRTHRTDSKGAEECILMDLKGKEIKRFYKKLPGIDLLSMLLGREVKKYDFANGKFYWLFDNEDDETVELHCEKIY